MPGVRFDHPDVGTLNLRLAPSSVEWTYNMNTSKTQTYAGEVVQVLSINFDQLTIEGQFGREGAHGMTKESGRWLPRRGAGQLRDFNSSERFGVGLHQMTEYFYQYFAIASQGHDARNVGNYDQRPMNVTYEGRLESGRDIDKPETWQIYPTSFPSFRRANDQVAPEWRIVAEVYEPAVSVSIAAEQEAITRLRSAVGYRPNNQFSDPLGRYLPQNYRELPESSRRKLLAQARRRALEDVDDQFEAFSDLIPAYTDEALEQLLLMGGSLPLSRTIQNTLGN